MAQPCPCGKADCHRRLAHEGLALSMSMSFDRRFRTPENYSRLEHLRAADQLRSVLPIADESLLALAKVDAPAAVEMVRRAA